VDINFEDLFGKEVKRYKHIDAPIIVHDKDKNIIPRKINLLEKLIQNKNWVASHPFLPFIGYSISERRVSKINKELPREKQGSIKKNRPIRYASHLDGLIYSYYGLILYGKYEQKIQNLGLNDVVIAYRKSDCMGRRADNINLSKEVFDQIKKLNGNCVALAFDIKSFYDNIDHKKLKTEWISLLEDKCTDGRLPPDHFNIFKSLTDYSFIDLRAISMYIGCKNKEKAYPECKDCYFLHKHELSHKLFSDPSGFRKFRKWYKDNPIIKTWTAEKPEQHADVLKNDRTFNFNIGILDPAPYGIPQGSPMSALLANIYMLPFDMIMKDFCDKSNAVYRRYSDDILIICDKDVQKSITDYMMTAIAERGNHLKIHQIENTKTSKSKCYDFTSPRIKEDPLQYLGFTFDGKKVQIRGSSMARYLRKSKRGVTSMRFVTQKKMQNMVDAGVNPKDLVPKLNRQKLYETYTHLGRKNFWTYVKRAFSDMDCSEIRKQMGHHFDRVKKMIDEEDKKLAEFISNLQTRSKLTA
jgi:hypothetical protein